MFEDKKVHLSNGQISFIQINVHGEGRRRKQLSPLKENMLQSAHDALDSIQIQLKNLLEVRKMGRYPLPILSVEAVLKSDLSAWH